jgi:ABC-type Mn2+/Zn2+ transport system ATPase subunit
VNATTQSTAGASSGKAHASACIRAQQLTLGYDRRPVVQGLTLDLLAGQALALVGTNGAGKSTFLKAVAGLLPVLEGRLEVLGTRPGGAADRVAYLSQFQSSGIILPLRAVDVVRMGRFPARGLFGRLTRADDELVIASMRRMGVDGLANASLRSLSGGQQRRVYLAQILARHAALLVLDEPTAGLDAAGKELYTAALRQELARGASVVVATHDIREAATCDLAMLLAHRVVALGPPREAITPEALLETFGIILVSQQAGGLAVVESEHGHDHEEHTRS